MSTEIRGPQQKPVEVPSHLRGSSAAEGPKGPNALERAVARELGIESLEGALAALKAMPASVASPAELADGQAKSAIAERAIALFDALKGEFLNVAPKGEMSPQFETPLSAQAADARAAGEAGLAVLAAASHEGEPGPQDANAMRVRDGLTSAELKTLRQSTEPQPAQLAVMSQLLKSPGVEQALRQQMKPVAAALRLGTVDDKKILELGKKIGSEAKRLSLSALIEGDVEAMISVLFMKIAADAGEDLRGLIKESEQILGEKKALRAKLSFIRDLQTSLKKTADAEYDQLVKDGTMDPEKVSREDYRAWRRFMWKETGDPAKPIAAQPCEPTFLPPGSDNRMVSDGASMRFSLPDFDIPSFDLSGLTGGGSQPAKGGIVSTVTNNGVVDGGGFVLHEGLFGITFAGGTDNTGGSGGGESTDKKESKEDDASGKLPAVPQQAFEGYRMVSLDQVEDFAKDTQDALDTKSEFGEMHQMRLQQYMERRQKAIEMLSNLIKKTGETAGNITQNLK
ncbi:MAG: hypothetical protein IT381_25245 [Deltaproteobacteria bacterium]|nr:hypothetical protein [Deltaproteobacteria bacterium]